MCVRVCDYAGCQVCGGKKEAPAVLPAHGDEQAHPDTAWVYCLPHQGNTSAAAAFLPVSAQIYTHTNMYALTYSTTASERIVTAKLILLFLLYTEDICV